MDIEQKIKIIIEEEGIEFDKDGKIVDIDSLRYISTIVSIEEEFGVEIPDEMLQFETLETLESIINFIKNE